MKRINVTLQLDYSDCGVCCLHSIVNFYNGTATIEQLRRLSGTTITGTTMLGLKTAAEKMSFSAMACKTSIEHLININKPTILSVVIDNHNHFVIFFGILNNKKTDNISEMQFHIGDPASGLITYNYSELERIWQNKVCLILEPSEAFKTSKFINREKTEWIKQFLGKDFSLLSITSFIGVLCVGLGMSMFIFSQRLVDDILPTRDSIRLYLGIATVFILLTLKEIFSYLRSYLLIRQAREFNSRVNTYFYKKLLSLQKDFFDTRKIGDLTARLNDIVRIQRVISQLAGSAITDILVVIISTTIIFYYSLVVGIGCILTMPVFFGILYHFNSRVSESQNEAMKGYAMAESNYISTLQGIESIKNFNKENLFETANALVYDFFQKNILSLGKIQIRITILANMFAAFFLIGVLIFTSHEVLNSKMKIGQLIAILGIIAPLLQSTASLAMLFIPISEAKIAFNRMFEFTSLESEYSSDSNIKVERFESISASNIVFRFAGRSPLFKNLDFQVKKGEIIGLLGENGSGKSTLGHLIQKYYNYENGRVVVNQTILHEKIKLSEWRKMTSVVPQNVHIFNTTVLENIAFEDALQKPQEVLSFLKEFGFLEFIESLPQSYLTLVGEEGINLSGGQKQMIALARSMYSRPQLLILDEATSAMDRLSEQFVLELLEKMRNEMGVIFITHRLHIFKNLCDRIYILQNGETTISGDHNTLLLSDNLYSKYWKDLVAQ